MPVEALLDLPLWREVRRQGLNVARVVRKALEDLRGHRLIASDDGRDIVTGCFEAAGRAVEPRQDEPIGEEPQVPQGKVSAYDRMLERRYRRGEPAPGRDGGPHSGEGRPDVWDVLEEVSAPHQVRTREEGLPGLK